MNKKLSFSVILLLMAICMHAADFTTVSLDKNGGGVISDVNHVIRSGGALYAATSDGVWTSPSGAGGDWEAYGSGLSGAVSLLNFDNKELALTADGKLHASTAGTWSELDMTGTVTAAGVPNILQDGNIIMVPKGVQNDSGNEGFFRSIDGGANFTDLAVSGNRFSSGIAKMADGTYVTTWYTGRTSQNDINGNKSQFWISSDQGATMTKVPGSYAFAVGSPRFAYTFESAKAPGTTYYFLGGEKDVVRFNNTATITGGDWNDPANWSCFIPDRTLDIPDGDTNLTSFPSLYFKGMTLASDGNLYLLSKDAMYVSTDEGATYTVILEAAADEDFLNMDGTIYDLYVASTKGIYTFKAGNEPWDGISKEAVSKGTGTLANPYLIENEAQWAWITDDGNAAAKAIYESRVWIRLTRDLDFNNQTTPYFKSFKANFDGGNHKLYNVKTVRNGNNAIALFTAADSCIIANLGIESGYIEGYRTAGFTTRNINVKLINCYNKASIYTWGENVGGLMGEPLNVNNRSDNLVLNCFNAGLVNGEKTYAKQRQGGLVGYGGKNNYSAVKNSYNYGWVTNAAEGYENPTINVNPSASTWALDNVYYSTDSTLYTGAQRGTGMTSDAMRTQAFADALNGDGPTAWKHDPDINNGYPYINAAYTVVLPDVTDATVATAEGYDTLFVYKGDDYKFSIVADDPSMGVANLVVKNYDEVLVADKNGVYTIENVTDYPSITVSGALTVKTFTVTPQVTGGGSIAPATPQVVEYGDDLEFTITPSEGYVITSILVNDAPQTIPGEGEKFKLEDIVDDILLEVVFAKETFVITARASAGGSILEAEGSENPVTYGEDITFVVTPETGYEVETVEVDGVTVSLTDGKYTFTNVTKVHTIDVTFALKQYTITASAGEGGAIDPDGEVSVSHGLNQVFTITPDANYKVASVLVDNATASLTDGKYTFTNVTGAHTISVTFESTVGLKNALVNGWTITSANSLIQVTSAEAASFDVQLYNVSGKLLSITASEGNTAYVNAAPGSAYIVKIVCENETFTVKVAN